MSELLLDPAGRRRSPATLPGFHAGHAPGNKGLRYPADPPKVEEIIAVMRTAGDGAHGRRLRGLIVSCGAPGCGSRKRSRSPKAISISAAARCWSGAARAGAVARSAWTPGAGSSSSRGSTAARAPGRSAALRHQRPDARRRWSPAAARAELRRTAASAGVRRRFAPHQLRHAHAVEMAREGVPLIVIQRQLGHSNLGITSVYLQGIDSGEIIETVHARRAPMIPVSASLRL